MQAPQLEAGLDLMMDGAAGVWHWTDGRFQQVADAPLSVLAGAGAARKLGR